MVWYVSLGASSQHDINNLNHIQSSYTLNNTILVKLTCNLFIAESVFWPNKYPTRSCVIVAFLSTSASHSCQCISLHVEHLGLEPVTASLFGSILWAVQHWSHQCALSSRTCSASSALERRNGTYTKTLYEPGRQIWFLEVLVQRVVC